MHRIGIQRDQDQFKNVNYRLLKLSNKTVNRKRSTVNPVLVQQPAAANLLKNQFMKLSAELINAVRFLILMATFSLLLFLIFLAEKKILENF